MLLLLGLLLIICPVLLICWIPRENLKIAGFLIVLLVGLAWLYSYIDMSNCGGPGLAADACMFAGIFPFMLFLGLISSFLAYGIRMIFTRPKE